MSIFAQKFGHFNSADIITVMPEYTQAQEDIKKLGETYEADIKAMEDELKAKADAYEKEAATLPDNIKARREQELQELYQRTQQIAAENQQAFQQAQQEKLAAIQEKVIAAIKKVGDAQGYVYIVDTTGGAIPYINTTLSTDVTADIKKVLGI